MRRSDFHYDLPDTCIAQRPPARRGDSRLLHLERATGRCTDRHITDLPTLLAPGDLLVLNDTRVIPARLHGRKASGGAVEIFVERVLGNQRFSAKIRASKTPKPGTELIVGEFRLTVGGRDDELFLLQLTTGELEALLAEHGHIPLPPYIRRPDEHTDRERYQTVWAREPGAVAAPTAGLHFDDALLDAMRARGVGIDYLTLHVGAGTYQRVRTQDLSRHQLHAERVIIGVDLVERINATRRAGGRVVAVGTTVVRSLEAAAADGELTPFADETRLFIKPGYRFRVVDALLTNFHEPESTLLMLVCAFAGRQSVLDAYRHAVANDYRFLSYGDAMWID
ncbi:tRNA preQ1(34) S-adenosylmethionine ribosyltransferase-isomerase QueA [Salinisphaera sp. P385]|uniref:S-adenosylmethionine:tRNA ribosyltransferase-isomerase n=1 Tax=Spectribacter acetivorans TaxID=3075603 RepID=A0ABU3BDV9_9GAMM|nr:tRNA preQ1(34) S-adenosylmethionine ribosyltransferase-isomerase QueA [Salinisphaera sp. P385]MDT0619516.1 tRNA preQ1(34) S-adenosylmethionine ribosyltransferase-isomerase QueA [Salinisphaera sp. P385]